MTTIKSKFHSQPTTVEVNNVHGKAHISFIYQGDKPCMLSFSAHKKDKDDNGREYGDERHHHITLSLSDIQELKKLIDTNLINL